LGLAHHVPHPLPVSVLAHRAHPQLLPGHGIAADQKAAGLQDPLSEQLGRFVEHDDIHPAIGRETGERYCQACNKASAFARIGDFRQDGYVEVAVSPGRVPGSRAEDGESRDPWDRLGEPYDLIVQVLHHAMVALSRHPTCYPSPQEVATMVAANESQTGLATEPEGALARLRAASRVGVVLSGGSARCAFQVGVLETLGELGVRTSLVVAVSGGAWNGAALATGTVHRLRRYWRAFWRMPYFDLSNLLREHSPYRFTEMHRRTFARYVGVERLRAPGALPLLIGVTRLRDLQPRLFDARAVDDPFLLCLASNYLPPFYTHAPRLDGELYGDGGLTDNLPYERAFAEGCDAVILVTMKGESEGGLYRSPRDSEHVVPASYSDRTIVIRPRHRLAASFTESRWPVLREVIELGRLRAREVLLGERHAETDLRPEGFSPTALLTRLLHPRASYPAG